MDNLSAFRKLYGNLNSPREDQFVHLGAIENKLKQYTLNPKKQFRSADSKFLCFILSASAGCSVEPAIDAKRN